MGGIKPSGHAVCAVSIAMIVLGSTAIALRFIAKATTKKAFAVEDWCIITSFILFCGFEGVFLGGLIASGGSLTEISITGYGNFLKYSYVMEILFTCTITAVKVSILSLYCSIFPTKTFKRASIAVGVLCLVWAVVCLSITIFKCRPIAAAWDLSLVTESHCTSYGRYTVGYELTNMFLDIAILCLPIVVIRRLQLPTQRKIMVGGIFLLGGFICIICVIRLIYIANLSRKNLVDINHALNWGNAELTVAIVCACLPTYGPFLRKSPAVPSYLKGWYTSLRSRAAPHSSDNRKSKGSSKDNKSRYDHLDDPGEDRMHLTQVGGSIADQDLSGKGTVIPLNAIHVQRKVEVV